MGTGTFTTRIFCAWCTPCCEAASSTRARSGKPDAFLEPFYTTYDHLPRQARDKRRESSTKRRITQGHGLKITQQNDTLIENCTVTDNRWQGIWVGGESAGNWDLRILGCTIERNHMCVQCTQHLTKNRLFEVMIVLYKWLKSAMKRFLLSCTGTESSSATLLGLRCGYTHLMPLRNPPLFLSAFPMFSPSVSW
jgi:parallel beta-helix repeat protein